MPTLSAAGRQSTAVLNRTTSIVCAGPASHTSSRAEMMAVKRSACSGGQSSRMVARIPSASRPRVNLATGIRLFCSVIRRRFRASIPPVKRTSTVFRATPVAGSGTVFLDHLVDRHARWDHGVHIGLGVDVEVEDGASFLLLRPPHGLLDAIALADRTPREPVGGREPFVVRSRYGRLGVAAVVEELLPLADHPEVAVVQDGDLY